MPLFIKQPPPSSYFSNPSLFMRKICILPFWENFENSNPYPPYIKGGGRATIILK